MVQAQAQGGEDADLVLPPTLQHQFDDVEA
jgi:hypothetical protein